MRLLSLFVVVTWLVAWPFPRTETLTSRVANKSTGLEILQREIFLALAMKGFLFRYLYNN